MAVRSNIFAPAAAEGGGEREGGPYSSGGLGDTFESQNQLVSMQPQDYLQQRADDVEQVESTIRELGGIFGQLANIVAEQDEMVHRYVYADARPPARSAAGTPQPPDRQERWNRAAFGWSAIIRSRLPLQRCSISMNTRPNCNHAV